MGQQWPAVRVEALGAADLGLTVCGIALLEEVDINPTTKPPVDNPQTAEQLPNKFSQ